MRDVKMANERLFSFTLVQEEIENSLWLPSCHGNLGDEVTPEIFVWWGAEEPLAYQSLFC